MIRIGKGFEGVLTKINTKKHNSEREDVVLEFSIRYTSKYDNQTFLDTYESKCDVENVSVLFREPVHWKSLALEANYKFSMEFDELPAFECILRAIKVRRRYSAKDMSDAFTYDLVFEKEIEDGNQDWHFAHYLNRKEEDEDGKKSLMTFLIHLEPLERVVEEVKVSNEDDTSEEV